MRHRELLSLVRPCKPEDEIGFEAGQWLRLSAVYGQGPDVAGSGLIGVGNRMPVRCPPQQVVIGGERKSKKLCRRTSFKGHDGEFGLFARLFIESSESD